MNLILPPCPDRKGSLRLNSLLRKRLFVNKLSQANYCLRTLLILIVFVLLFSGCVDSSPPAEAIAPSALPEEAVSPRADHSQVDSAVPAIAYQPNLAVFQVRQNVLVPTPPPSPTIPIKKPTATATRRVIIPPTITVLPSATAPALAALPTLPPETEPLAVTLTLTVPLEVGIRHVVIISVDGLRPDALFLAATPNLDKLIAQGSYCPTAQTLSLSITLPSHASMLGGMVAEKHGILWGVPYIGWPGMTGPTLFSVAHEAGLSTAMIFGKEKMNYLVLPNSVDQVYGMNAHDPEIRDWALEVIEAGLPNALFIHFPDTDRVGHAYGWMSENQFYAITYVDGLIGEVVTAMQDDGYWPNTLLIVTADHGGHGMSHGDDSPLDRTIPWLAVGSGVPGGVTLTHPINTYDTAATALHALHLPIPDTWDGQPVLDIFQ